MDQLKQDFLLGFQEGWGSFWSPFAGLCGAIAKTWRNRFGS